MKVERPNEPRPGGPGAERISVLDETLWSRFDQSRDLGELSRIWLALQIRQIGPVAEAVVVLDRGDEGFIPVARWPPQEGGTDERLTEAVEASLARETQVLSAGAALAQPLFVDGKLIGAVGLLFEPNTGNLTGRLRQLRWGTGWLIEVARGALMKGAEEERERIASVLDLLGTALDADSFKGACLAAVNMLARRTGCDQVGLGFIRGRRLRLSALSDVADFRMNTGRTLALEQAMTEAADQEGSVLYPPRPGQSFMVDLAHAELHREGQLGELLTVPLFAAERLVGALHFQKPSGQEFTAAEVMGAEASAAALGTLLREKRLLERTAAGVLWHSFRSHTVRLLGPGYIGRKIAVFALALLAVFFAFAEGDFRVKAQAEVQGRVIRSIGAPFDGNIAEQFFRAGDDVREGEVLARLDDRDLRIELLRAQTDIRRYQGEYDRALADRNAPEARIVAASLAEVEARVELFSAQIERATLRAPFDAIVISGDLSQSLGAAVRRGEELFQIAPLESYRVRLEVNETDLDEIQIDQTGALALASLPSERFGVRIAQITPSLEAHAGENVAMVEAEILDAGQQIRPGMRGVAKIEIDRQLLITIWTRPILDWFRLALWRWTP